MSNKARTIKSFTDLDAWKEGHRLVLSIDKITRNYPKEELFGLVSQMRRCVVSITSNIAEGFSRQHKKGKVQFYSVALGSTTELQNQLIVSKDIHYLSKAEHEKLSTQSIKVHKIINGLIKSTKKRSR